MYTLPPDALGVLRSRLSRGQIALFTGAGFTRAATAVDGQPVPGSRDLRDALWPIAFPGEPVDDASTLAEVFGCAIEQSQKRVAALMEKCLRVSPENLPGSYRTWFAMPWSRMYTLNVDDLDDVAQRTFTLPRRIRPVSASQSVPVNTSDLWSIHLNGRIDDLPNVTFAPPQYGKRSPGRDPWYATLVADMLSMSFVFVGTSLDEPPLWEHLELRGERGRGRELRPRSFLVTPNLSVARRRMLHGLNIDYVPMDQEEFAAVLQDLSSEADAGHKAQAAIRRDTPTARIVDDLTRMRQQRLDVNRAQYLLGREPTWTDITDGFAIERTFEADLLRESTLLEPRLVLITGTAATGKSTSLRRLALAVEASGRTVGWVDPTVTEVGIPRIRDAIAGSGFDFVAIDDVDLFAEQAGPLMKAICETPDAPRLLVTARSTRAERFKVLRHISGIDHSHIVAPPLTDDDIDGLIDSLSRAGLLGQLAGKSYAQQRSVFSRLAGRQLLVAMLEATSGQRFEERIDDECSQLLADQALVYAIAAVATRYRLWLNVDEILAAVGEANAEQLRVINALVRQHLLVPAGDGGLGVRHRIIADRAVSWFRRQGQLREAVGGVVFAMAIQYSRTRNPSSRAFRLLIRLLNHRFMIEEIGDRNDARAIYESVATLLQDDFHFWLQRGSLETETGDLPLAENYLDQAKALAPDDYRIQTEWAYMSLKRAAEWAQNGEPGWRERAAQAMSELRGVIEARGALDSYPYHVIGSQGLHFLRRAPVTKSDKIRQLDALRKIVARGCRLHPAVDELKQLRDDLEREYLLMGTDVPRPSPDE